jgi:adenylylsulfate kinase
MIYWFYGQPGAGKTTLAEELLTRIDAVHVDGDGIRALFKNTDYSREGRIKNLTTVNSIVKFLDSKGFNVVVSVVSPFKELRDEMKEIGAQFYFVQTTEIRGREQNFVKDFEFSEEDTILDTTNKTIEEVINHVKLD